MKLMKIMMLMFVVLLLVSCNQEEVKKEVEKEVVVVIDEATQLDIEYHKTIDNIADAKSLEMLESQIHKLHRIDSIAKSITTKQENDYNESVKRNGVEYTDSITNELYDVSVKFTESVSIKMMYLKLGLDSASDSLNNKFKLISYK